MISAGRVSGVTASLLDDTSVQLTWRHLDSQDISGYRVYYTRVATPPKQARQAEGSSHDVPAEANSTRVGGLELGAEYSFQVVALVMVNGFQQEGPKSSVVTTIVVERLVTGVERIS